ncbi:SusC/RagA family TonB-linked outer membrane protein [Sphingobacterium ginsenosidimutans]|uniref:SusC/RagA family TonB-linked outer membrane protein n=1 Tax=Sphingobacterium ginsenosidimutans TaxID=687845 RepID=UPI0031F7895E
MKQLYSSCCIVAALSLTSISSLYAQQSITGRVTNATGNISGVTVSVKGSSRATQTLEDGSYSIQAQKGETLRFSTVGYIAQEIIVGDAKMVNVSLKPEDGSLEEVVVTGFATRKRSQIGSAVTMVSGEDLRRTGAVNPIAALQGLVPGLQVQPGVGGPQSTPVFRIRGSASLDPYNNQPLVVIDNIIMDQDMVLPNRGGSQDFGNILKDLNPDDIENISVLRGGAVTALYGSRAQNGVILITTKSGFGQRGLGVTVTQNTQWDQAYKTMDFQNDFGPGTTGGDRDFVKTPDGALQVPATVYNFGPKFTGQTVKDYDGRDITYSAIPNNMLDAYRTGISTNTTVGISGGSAQGSFRLAYSNNSSQGVTPNNNFNRNSVNFRGTQRLLGKIIVDANVTYVKSKARNAADVGAGNSMLSGNTDVGSVLVNFVAGLPRYYDTKYWMENYISPQGGWNREDGTNFSSVLYNLYQNNRVVNDDNFRGAIDVQVPINDNFKFQGFANINYLGSNYENKSRGRDSAFYNPQYSTSISSRFTKQFRGTLHYTKKINDFNVMFMGGGEYYSFSGKGQNARIDGAIYPDIYRLSNSRNRAIAGEDKPNSRNLGSLFYQGSVDYKDELTLNVYGRNDWNSSLVYNDGHGSYSYFYPGVDAIWKFNETFNEKLGSLFNYGALRLSYVQTGNGTGAYTTNTGAYGTDGPYLDYLGRSILNYRYQSNTLPNQALKPERSTKIEAGLEFRMLKNRLGADFSFYSQDSRDQIIEFGTPMTSGVTKALLNGGEVRNRGIELVVYGVPIKTDNFSWDTRFNYTRNRNTILSLPFGLEYTQVGGGDGYQAIAKVGGDYGTVIAPYGYAKYQAVDGGNKPIDSELNGKRVLYTPNGASTIYERAANYKEGLDKAPVLGSILPKFLGNWRNTFNYKSLQLVVGLDAKYGGMVYSSTKDFGSWTGILASTLPGRSEEFGGVAYTTAAGVQRNDGVIMDGVYKQGSTTTVGGKTIDLGGMTHQQAVDAGYMRPASALAYYANSHSWFSGIRERAMYESSWISVQQVSLNYDLPGHIAKRLKMNGLRVGVYGNDLFFLYNSAPDGFNPYSVSDSGSGAMNEGSAMPYVRRFGFSINGSF